MLRSSSENPPGFSRGEFSKVFRGRLRFGNHLRHVRFGKHGTCRY
jgi:hypothetical protein